MMKAHNLSAQTVLEIARHRIPIVGNGHTLTQNIPWSPTAGVIARLAANEATALGHKKVGSAHLLLALISSAGYDSSAVLINDKINTKELRQEVLKQLDKAAKKRLADSSALDIKLKRGDSCICQIGDKAECVLVMEDAKRKDEQVLVRGIEGDFKTAASNLRLLYFAPLLPMGSN